MRARLIITFLLLFPIVNIFYSCVCNVITKYENYSHTTLLLKNLDNSGEKAIETESLQINKNSYGIRLYLTREKSIIACIKQKKIDFIQSAYAQDVICPPEYIFSPDDSIVSIKIVTINSFDNQHSENSDISDYFRVAHSYSTIENYVANMLYTYPSDSEVFFEDKLSIDLLLMTTSTTNNKQQFEVQVALSDGRVLKQQTLEIELL